MTESGHYCLALTWLLSVYGLCAGTYAGINNRQGWYQSVKNSTLLAALFSGAAVFILGFGFLNNDYTNQYIWQYSNRDMDPVYKLTAIWGGMDGSLLFWGFILAFAGACVAWRSRNYPRAIMPWVLAVLNSSYLFFFTIVLFFTNPFRYLQADFIPPDGNGLNPLLQNPYMAIHPPMLYAGFTLFAIPFAICMGALLSGTMGSKWIQLTREWTLIAWAFLTVGIVLGGYWAYIELGWGGFWAWDPVENASFLPWLTGTAFLHSVIVQKRRKLLRLWNVWLISLTYGLTIFGTFLTRSGIVQSVHSFASTDIGWVFLLYLSMIFGFTLILTFYRRKELRPEGRIESLLSREAAFLVANLILLSICFATWWGVMFPVFSEAITGVKQAIGAPYFNTINVPLFLIMILLMGVGPLISWRKTDSWRIKAFILPLVAAVVSGLLFTLIAGLDIYPSLAYSLCLFVFIIIYGGIRQDFKTSEEILQRNDQNLLMATCSLLSRKRRAYGAHLVHIGVLVCAVAITAATAHKTEKEFTLSKNETLQIGRYALTLDAFEEARFKNYSALKAEVRVKMADSGKMLSVLKPELRHYFRNRENTSEIALRMGLREDVYLVLAGLDNTRSRAAFKLYINPLQVWLWFGITVMIVGAGLALLPQTNNKPAFDAETPEGV